MQTRTLISKTGLLFGSVADDPGTSGTTTQFKNTLKKKGEQRTSYGKLVSSQKIKSGAVRSPREQNVGRLTQSRGWFWGGGGVGKHHPKEEILGWGIQSQPPLLKQQCFKSLPIGETGKKISYLWRTIPERSFSVQNLEETQI